MKIYIIKTYEGGITYNSSGKVYAFFEKRDAIREAGLLMYDNPNLTLEVVERYLCVREGGLLDHL